MTLVDPTKSHHVTGNISLLFEAQKKTNKWLVAALISFYSVKKKWSLLFQRVKFAGRFSGSYWVVRHQRDARAASFLFFIFYFWLHFEIGIWWQVMEGEKDRKKVIKWLALAVGPVEGRPF